MDLYGEEDGRLVLMTKDHIIPRSKNGTNEDSNYQCLCAICNNLKSHYFLTAEDIRKLRELSKNKDKLTPKELRKLINFTRWQLQKNNGEGDTIY
jgi:5-methylcytosine-specific restriction endonuclease McrA